jgi:hypothetical protein
MRDKRYPVVGDPCVCGEGHLEFVKGGNRWDVDHLMCSKCDGTYALIEQPMGYTVVSRGEVGADF